METFILIHIHSKLKTIKSATVFFPQTNKCLDHQHENSLQISKMHDKVYLEVSILIQVSLL